MKLQAKYFNGIKVFVPDILNDRNLSFCERVFSWSTCNALGIPSVFPFEYDVRFEYENTLRGLYFQNPPHFQSVLIRCITGSAIVAAVPMNPNSKYYKKYFKYEINQNNRHQVFIPPGYAIGFYSLMNSTVISIKASDNFLSSSLLRLNPFDKSVGITWPIDKKVLISALDVNAPNISDTVTFYSDENRFGEAGKVFEEELTTAYLI